MRLKGIRQLGVQRLLLALVFLLAPVGLSGDERLANPLDGFTPKALEPGTPAGSFLLSGFESVNLFNGKLNAALPLLDVGGRGDLSHTIQLRFEQPWKVEVTSNCATTVACEGGVVTSVLILPTFWGPTEPPNIGANEISIPGFMYSRRARDYAICPAGGPNPNKLLPHFSVTRLTFINGDGSEIELVDSATMGAPHTLSGPCLVTPAPTGFNRGRKFVSHDGSALTFIADADVIDSVEENTDTDLLFNKSGNLLFPDGTTYRFQSGAVVWIRDRNGNKIDFGYGGSNPVVGPLVQKVTDPLGRAIDIQRGLSHSECSNTITRLEYDGTNGVRHQIDLCYEDLDFTGAGIPTAIPALRPGESVATLAQLFPELDVGNLQSGTHNPRKPAWVELPDGRKYRFQFNSYGELARIELPTGGAFEYDWINGYVEPTPAAPPSCFNSQLGVSNDPLSNNPCRGGFNKITGTSVAPISIYRRVFERRVCPSGETNGACKQFTRYFNSVVPSGPEIGNTEVLVEHRSSSALLSSETHRFKGQVRALGSDPANPLHYAAWKKGRKLHSEVIDTSDGLIQSTDNTWSQMNDQTLGWCASVPAAYCANFTADNQPSNNPRLAENISTLHDGASTFPAKSTFEYDVFNNQTKAYSYNFDNTPARMAQTTYLNSDASYVDPLPGQPNYAQIRLRRLVSKQQTCGFADEGDACTTSNSASQFEFLYDESTPNAVPTGSSGITGHCASTSAPTGNEVDFRCIAVNPASSPTNFLFDSSFNTRGNVTEIKGFKDATNSVSVTRKYDAAGNIVEFKDAKLNAYTANYADVFTSETGCATSGPKLAFPTAITNPLGHVTQIKYDCGLGAATDVTDPNDVLTTFNFESGLDELDRPVLMTQDFGGFSAKTAFEYTDTVGSLSVMTKRDQFAAGDGNLITETFFDGVGRAKRTSLTVPDGEGLGTDETCTTYDARGRTKTTSNPGRNACSTDVTTNTYDALGRITEIKHPDDSVVATEYAGNVTTVTDEAGKKRKTTTDALGRLSQVIEDPDTLNYTTDYQYDLLDNLVTVTQRGNPTIPDPVQTRTFAYDRLSRLVCASNPESRTDLATCSVTAPTSGVDRFTYDNNGNLKTKADARGVTATWGDYDALNRPTITTYSDGTPTLSYNYHPSGSSPCFNKGRLDTVVNSVSTMSVPCYDALGRATQSSQITAGTTYPFIYTYNLDSTLETQTYPDGLKVAYKYDTAGRPTKAGRNTVGQIDFAQNVLYAPHGVPDQFTLGNGLTETTTYNNRLQPCTMTASTLLTLTFKYGATDSGNCDVESDDNNGNILQQVISASGNPTFTQKYTYDAVNRIKTVGENNDFWQRTYSYDAFGNRAATGSGITMGSPTPTAVTQFDAATNRITKLPTGVDLDPDPAITTDDPYDEAGNLVRHPIVGSMAYDANNKQRFYCTGHVTCTSGNAIAEYRYDGAGNRVEKVTSAETTTFVYDAFGKLAAEYSTTPPTNSGLFFRTLDHLGSTRLVTDAADPPSVVSRRDFLPFGEHIPADATFNRQALAGYNAGSAFRQQFTAKERDDESGLDYFLARYYSAGLGRFTSVDPGNAGAQTGNPQLWNGYTYVSNRPLVATDPDGRVLNLVAGGVGAIAGGLIGGGLEFAVQATEKLSSGQRLELDGDKILASFVKGAAVGGAAGLTGGISLGVQAGVVATASVGGGIAERAIDGDSATPALSLGDSTADFVSGLATPLIPAAIAKKAKDLPIVQEIFEGAATKATTVGAITSSVLPSAAPGAAAQAGQTTAKAGVEFVTKRVIAQPVRTVVGDAVRELREQEDEQ